MSPLEQEAKSRKYSTDACVVLKLSTGQFALFDCQHQLIEIGEWEELRQAYERRPTYIPPPSPKAGGDLLEELGL